MAFFYQCYTWAVTVSNNFVNAATNPYSTLSFEVNFLIFRGQEISCRDISFCAAHESWTWVTGGALIMRLCYYCK